MVALEWGSVYRGAHKKQRFGSVSMKKPAKRKPARGAQSPCGAAKKRIGQAHPRHPCRARGKARRAAGEAREGASASRSSSTFTPISPCRRCRTTPRRIRCRAPPTACRSIASSPTSTAASPRNGPTTSARAWTATTGASRTWTRPASTSRCSRCRSSATTPIGPARTRRRARRWSASPTTAWPR